MAIEATALERRIAVIPQKDWYRFEAWAAEPARKITGLRELARKFPTSRSSADAPAIEKFRYFQLANDCGVSESTATNAAMPALKLVQGAAWEPGKVKQSE